MNPRERESTFVYPVSSLGQVLPLTSPKQLCDPHFLEEEPKTEERKVLENLPQSTQLISARTAF